MGAGRVPESIEVMQSEIFLACEMLLFRHSCEGGPTLGPHDSLADQSSGST